MNTRILLVEDDALLGDGLRAGLRQLGFNVDWVRDGQAAERELRAANHDAAVLDLGLPMKDGMDVLAAARAEGVKLPVLVLTARDALSERIRGLDLGADDYVVKPIDLSELAARLRALVRRSKGQAQAVLEYGELQLFPASQQVTYRGEPVKLTPHEYKLLQELITQSGRVLSRDQLQQSLYGWDEGAESNAVEVHIHHLRKKLGSQRIQTIRGVGYMLMREASTPI